MLRNAVHKTNGVIDGIKRTIKEALYKVLSCKKTPKMNLKLY